MSELTDDEVAAVQSWLDRHQFEHVSSLEGDSEGFGDRQDVWERDRTLLRITRDRGPWWYDLSCSGTNVWLDVDGVVGAMGFKSTAPVERVADVAASIDDHAFGALATVVRSSP